MIFQFIKNQEDGSNHKKTEVDKQIKQLINKGIVRTELLRIRLPSVLVKNKNGEIRICQVFRKLNQKIGQERYLIPNIEELDSLQGAKIFTTTDLRNGFFHLPLEEES